jgi:hypothetical protein
MSICGSVLRARSSQPVFQYVNDPLGRAPVSEGFG